MSHLLRVLVVLSAVAAPGAALAQCTKDTECKGDRVCENGACVSPGERAVAPPPPATQPPPPPPAYRPPPPRPAEPMRAPELGARLNVVSVDPLSIIRGALVGAQLGVSITQVGAIYERAVLPQLSIYGTLTPGFTSGSPPIILGVMGGVRWYVVGGAPAGPWVGGQLGLLPLNLGPGAHLEGGYQWILDNGIALGVNGRLEIGQDLVTAGNVAIRPMIAGNVGWNF